MTRAVWVALLAATCLLALVFFSVPSPQKISEIPAPAVRVPPPIPPDTAALIAVILDDFGENWRNVDSCLALPSEVAFAVIPHLRDSVRVARACRDRGFDVFLHQPMEPHDFPKENPGRYGIYVWQSPEEVAMLLRENIAALEVPIVGVNNHMGSKATEDRALMDAFFDAFPRHLIFLDSRTSSQSVAFDAARARGILALKNNVFLDAVYERASIEQAMDQLVRQARSRGRAIGIGHVYSGETIAALHERLPRLGEQGVRLVRLSELAGAVPRPN